MENWIQLISFTFPHEAHLAKAKLESEGIETILRDELTTQVHNFYSNAIGGVKLLVKESDFNQAYTILKDSRIIITDENRKDEHLQERLSNIFKSRYFFLLTIIIALVGLTVILFSIPTIPTRADKLTFHEWCFDRMYYQDFEVIPSTLPSDESQIIFVDKCWEKIIFFKNGLMQLPGFETEKIIAKWKVENKKLSIIPLNDNLSLVTENKDNVLIYKEPLENLYYGVYEIKFEDLSLILESERRMIYAYR
ncbi:MAG: DUF2007 domain-containing protein [Bacteroidales bacterium]|nr:DUF2007 domain-containing protein [Bacteroidales bacterium]